MLKCGLSDVAGRLYENLLLEFAAADASKLSRDLAFGATRNVKIDRVLALKSLTARTVERRHMLLQRRHPHMSQLGAPRSARGCGRE